MGGAHLVDEGARDDRLEHRVERLAQVLDEQRRAVGHRALDAVEVAALRELQRHQPVGRLVLLDPRDALQLRVDDQREARALDDD